MSTKELLLICVIAFLFGIVVGMTILYYSVVYKPHETNNWPGDSSSDVLCTMDAMVCPDGSSVGRIGPNCEFAPCPVVDLPPLKPVSQEKIQCPPGYYAGVANPDDGWQCFKDGTYHTT